MPVLSTPEDHLPVWSQLDFYQIIELGNKENLEFTMRSLREVLMVVSGSCRLFLDSREKVLKFEDVIEIDQGTVIYNLSVTVNSCSVIRIGGNWQDPAGGRGVFKLNNSDKPGNTGDPVYYESQRKTFFDNHFHDCDEYWIIYKGSGKIATEGNIYEIYPGNCVATRAGDHHDFIEIYEEIWGIYFETSLKGLKRIGHLWESKKSE